MTCYYGNIYSTRYQSNTYQSVLSVPRYGTLVKGRVEAIVRDANGNIVEKRGQPMKSFTRNFAVLLANLFSTPVTVTSGTTSTTCYPVEITLPYKGIGIDGYEVTMRLVASYNQPNTAVTFSLYGLKASRGESHYGIQIGKDGTPPAPGNDRLFQEYGVTEFEFGDVTVEAPVTSGNTTTFRVIRNFTSKLTTDASVAETGLFYLTRIPYCDKVYLEGLLIARDVFSPAVTVPAGGTLTVRYIISVTT